MARAYRLFGLSIASEIPLPELRQVDAADNADVFIELGEVGERGPPYEWPKPIERGHAITFPGVASFAVQDGHRIVVASEPGVPLVNVRLYLLGSVMGILLHQRGMMPLHANLIGVDGRAIAFAGESGAGKSTLASEFDRAGFPVLSDDVCVLLPRDGECPLVTPGVPRLRLWRDAIERSGGNPSDFLRSYAGDERWEKYDLPLPVGEVPSEPLALSAIYVLVRGQAFSIAPIEGAAKVEALAANTYRGAYINRPETRLAHMKSCLALAEKTPMYELKRTFRADDMALDMQRIRKHFQQVGNEAIE